jgi:hypothetical protein
MQDRKKGSRGISATMVYGGLGLSVLLLIGVIFLLPKATQNANDAAQPAAGGPESADVADVSDLADDAETSGDRPTARLVKEPDSRRILTNYRATMPLACWLQPTKPSVNCCLDLSGFGIGLSTAGAARHFWMH